VQNSFRGLSVGFGTGRGNRGRKLVRFDVMPIRFEWVRARFEERRDSSGRWRTGDSGGRFRCREMGGFDGTRAGRGATRLVSCPRGSKQANLHSEVSQ
jgi:hypothetical protein